MIKEFMGTEKILFMDGSTEIRTKHHRYKTENGKVYAEETDYLDEKKKWFEVKRQLLLQEDPATHTPIKLMGYDFSFTATGEEEIKWLADQMGLKIVLDKDALNQSIKKGKCLQCGNCCQVYGHIDLTDEDISRWKNQGRFDILRHVDETDPDNGWINPRTGDNYLSGRCPWLRKVDGHFICKIHDTKPTICRDFPVSITQLSHVDCQGFPWKDLLQDYAFIRE